MGHKVVLFTSDEGHLLGWVTPTRHWASKNVSDREKAAMLKLIGDVRGLVRPYVDNGHEVVRVRVPLGIGQEFDRFRNVVKNL
jgi:hypothetical protein